VGPKAGLDVAKNQTPTVQLVDPPIRPTELPQIHISVRREPKSYKGRVHTDNKECPTGFRTSSVQYIYL
jgi:hypothetical protein